MKSLLGNVRFYLVAVALVVAIAKIVLSPFGSTTTPVLDWALTLAASVVIFVDNIRALFKRARGVDLRRIEKATLGLIKAVHRQTGVDVMTVGVSIFVPGRKRSRRSLRRQAVLKRIVRERINDSPLRTEVLWLRDKGVVGAAWTAKEIRHKDLTPWHDRSPVTHQELLAMSRDDAGGFTVDEFEALREKYSEVLAVPMWTDDQLRPSCVGVLAVDLPKDYAQGHSGTRLNTEAVRDEASAAAKTLARLRGISR